MTQAVLRPHDQLTHDEFTAISKAVHEFEALWRQTRNPAIAPFLPDASDPLRLRLLIELLRIDQEHRWERGDRRLLEQYLQDWPELAEQPAAIQELLDAECLTRFCLEDSPTRDELRQRFPQFADAVDLDRLRATALAEKGEASTAKARGNDATMINVRPQVGDELPPTTSFPAKSETSAVLAARRIGLLTGKQFGRYEVRRLVGTGGMGAVYEARDTQLDRIVALKIPRSELVNDPVILQRFLNEARAAGAIRHPNICPIYDVGQIDGQHFITMPLVEGMSLSAWMEHRTVSLHEAAEITRKLASALQAIHSAGIRHRDIKASNVMIDERGEPLLMDFGLARLAQADTHVTQSGSLVGTPAYMAPEQIQLGASGGDERSDLYSLGVLLYQMLTGRLPFEGPMTKVLVDIATKDPPRLETLRPDVDPNLAAICRKAMSRDPAQRFQTAAAVGQAFQPDPNAPPIPLRHPNAPQSDAVPHSGQPGKADLRSAFQPDPNAPPTPALQKPTPQKSEPKDLPPAPIASIRATRPSGQARKPDLRWVAAAIFFVLAAAIVIKISDRAELVIKSNVEGLEVKVRQLAQPEQERTLTIGENSVRVRSGQVEVVLTGANADEYEVVGDKITLKRFGREIVEVKRRAVGQAFQPDPNASPTPNRNTAQSEGSSRSGQPRKADLREPSAWDDLDPARIPEAERVPRQPEGLVAVLGQHRRRVWNLIRSASVSADGSQYSLTTEDGLYLFDRVLKKPVRFFPGTSHGGIHSAAFLLDGRLAMFNPESHGIELQIFAKPRDNGPLEKQSAVTTNCKSGIFHPMASSDGRWLAAYEDIVEKANFSLWQLSDAAPQRAGQFVLPNPHGGISPGCFSPDGQWFCFTDNHNTQSAVHLIDLRVDTPREAVVLKAEADEKSDAPAKGFQHAVFFADGRLATADRNGRTWFWKLNDGEPRRVGSIPASGALLHAPTKSLRLVVNPTDRFHVWDLSVEPPKLLGTSSSSFPIDNIQNAAIAPDGETVFTAHLNGAVRFWSVTPNGVTELDPLAPNPKRYGALGQTKVVGNLLCASSETDRLSIWQPTRNGLEVIPNPTPLRRVFEKHAKQQLLIVDEIGSVGIQLLRLEASRWNPSRRLNAATVRSAALNDDGRRLAVGRYNGTEEILELWGWDSDDSPARKLTEVKAGTEYIMDLAFAEEGRTLVSRHGRQAVEIWNVQDDQFVPRAKLPPRVFDQFAIAPNGRTLATVEAFNLELWNLTSDLQQPTASFAIPGSGAVAFSPDGKRLAASFWENGASAGVQLINLATGVVEKRLTCPGQVDQLDFTDDSRHLITGNANGTIYVVRLP